MLRTAQALAAANVPPKRITRSIQRAAPPSARIDAAVRLSICAVADHVVVKEGGSRWQAESGQYLLAFETDADGSISVIEEVNPDVSAESHFTDGAALEIEDAAAAVRAYEDAVAADPMLLDAHINLGRLLHESGRHAHAERVYRRAIKACGNEPLLLYNLGVLLDDMSRKAEAMQAYEAALNVDPTMADCHYNLALLFEDLQKPKDAIRHMAQYRRLMGGKRG